MNPEEAFGKVLKKLQGKHTLSEEALYEQTEGGTQK
jgi:hypothetical protein